MSRWFRWLIPTKKKVLSEEYDWYAGNDEKYIYFRKGGYNGRLYKVSTK